MIKKTIAAAAVVCALAAAGCSKSSDSEIVARVNQTKITGAEFKKQLEGLDNPQMQQSVVTDSKARKDFLEDLISIELVLQEAKRQGLDKDPGFKKRQELLRKEMELQVQNAIKNELFRNLLKKELATKLSAVEPPTEKEMREFYDKNRSKMVTMTGQKLSFKDVEPQIKNKLMQDKQREIYIAYTKELRAKAKVTVDDKALDAVAASLSQPTGTLQLTEPKVLKKGEAAPK